MDKNYKLLAIIGKSGAGKDSIFNTITLNPSYKIKNTHRVVGVTTRPMRENEEEGKDYYFISPSDFYALEHSGALFGVSNFRGWLYGTCFKHLDPDKINIGVFDPDRINDIMDNNPEIDLRVVNIMVSDKERILRQLNREANPDVDEIVRRYNAEKSEWNNCRFDIIPLFNNTAEQWNQCINTIQNLVASWGQKQ